MRKGIGLLFALLMVASSAAFCSEVQGRLVIRDIREIKNLQERLRDELEGIKELWKKGDVSDVLAEARQLREEMSRLDPSSMEFKLAQAKIFLKLTDAVMRRWQAIGQLEDRLDRAEGLLRRMKRRVEELNSRIAAGSGAPEGRDDHYRRFNGIRQRILSLFDACGSADDPLFKALFERLKTKAMGEAAWLVSRNAVEAMLERVSRWRVLLALEEDRLGELREKLEVIALFRITKGALDEINGLLREILISEEEGGEALDEIDSMLECLMPSTP